jgi:hypothetical protein
MTAPIASKLAPTKRGDPALGAVINRPPTKIEIVPGIGAGVVLIDLTGIGAGVVLIDLMVR